MTKLHLFCQTLALPLPPGDQSGSERTKTWPYAVREAVQARCREASTPLEPPARELPCEPGGPRAAGKPHLSLSLAGQLHSHIIDVGGASCPWLCNARSLPASLTTQASVACRGRDLHLLWGMSSMRPWIRWRTVECPCEGGRWMSFRCPAQALNAVSHEDFICTQGPDYSTGIIAH